MNKLMLLGRITNDLELQGSEGKEYLKFTLAVKRQRKREGQPEADFFRCTVFGATARALAKYTGKGKRISVYGRVELNKFEKDGMTYFSTDVLVDDASIIDFLEDSTNKADTSKYNSDPFKDDGRPIEISEDDIPF